MFILILNVLLAMIVEFKIRHDVSIYSTPVIHYLIHIRINMYLIYDNIILFYHMAMLVSDLIYLLRISVYVTCVTLHDRITIFVFIRECLQNG